VQLGRQTGPAAGVLSSTNPALQSVHVGGLPDVVFTHWVQLAGQTSVELLVAFVVVLLVFDVLSVEV